MNQFNIVSCKNSKFKSRYHSFNKVVHVPDFCKWILLTLLGMVKWPNSWLYRIPFNTSKNPCDLPIEQRYSSMNMGVLYIQIFISNSPIRPYFVIIISVKLLSFISFSKVKAQAIKYYTCNWTFRKRERAMVEIDSFRVVQSHVSDFSFSPIASTLDDIVALLRDYVPRLENMAAMLLHLLVYDMLFGYIVCTPFCWLEFATFWINEYWSCYLRNGKKALQFFARGSLIQLAHVPGMDLLVVDIDNTVLIDCVCW